MNSILTYLSDNWRRLSLDRFGDANRVSSILLTPRFRASSHVVFVVMAGKSAKPIVVVKVPRLPGDDDSLQREASNLQFVHSRRIDGFNSIPNFIGLEKCKNHSLLIETAIPGQTLSSRLHKKPSDNCFEKVVDWVIELHRATRQRPATLSQWHRQLVEDPLNDFIEVMPRNGREVSLTQQTLDTISAARSREIPLVCEHGDLGPPNVLIQRDNTLGVVDWELAMPKGLPAADLFFYLTLIAFAKRRACRRDDYLAAFDDAFFGPTAWARPFVTRYAECLHLPSEVMSTLFVATWARYFTRLVSRLHDNESSRRIRPETLSWLRTNRYYNLWCHSIAQMHRLYLTD